MPRWPKEEPKVKDPDKNYSVTRFYAHKGRQFEDGAAFRKAVVEYFKECESLEEPPTMNGLCLSLGTTRMSMMRWRNGRPDLEPEIELAKAIVEYYLEKQLLTNGKLVAGTIFNLVNNFGWKNVRIVEEDISFRAKKATEYDPNDAESIRRAYEETFGMGQTVGVQPEGSTARN